MNFIGLLRTLEQITRPPRRGAESEDGEPLAVSPDGYYGYAEPNLGADTEPGLTPDELVGVRGILQERYEPKARNAVADVARATAEAMRRLDIDLHTSASNHAGTGAESAPSPTIVQSAPPPTVDGEGSPADSGIPPSPAGERPPHPVPREQRQGTYCEDYETDGCSVDGCPIGCYHALKFRDDAAAEWIGGAVQVISGVLARHVPVNTSKHTPSVFCNSITGQYCHEYADWQAWRAHIAPLIAEALAPQPK